VHRAVEWLRVEVGEHQVEEMQEIEGRRELLLCGDVPELRQSGFLPSEHMRILSSDGVIRPLLSVWKRVKASHIEAIWSSLSSLAPITSSGGRGSKRRRSRVLPRERMRTPSLDGAIRSSSSVWKRVKASHMEA
jgi:hypothetical protein